MVDKKLSQFPDVDLGSASKIVVLDTSTKNGNVHIGSVVARTECVNKTAQDIKLTLSDGTLTLKSGSVITYPDGSQYQTASDLSGTVSAGGVYFVFTNSSRNALQIVKKENCFSGSSEPTGMVSGTYYMWLDTTNYVIKRTNNAGSSWTSGYTLTFGIVTVSGGQISSIDQVFNGAGYIGKSIFVLPGVNGFAPNGRNDDGTLKYHSITTSALAFYNNAETNVTNSVLVRAQSGGLGRGYWTESETIATSGRTYVPSKNRVYTSNGNEQSCFRVCRYSTSNGVITDFEIMPPFATASKYDLKSKQDVLTFDETPTENSTNPVTSGGVYAYHTHSYSNCIAKIHQDIKLELASDGTLTLKSGSIITNPDGSQYQITSDKTRASPGGANSYTGVVLASTNGAIQGIQDISKLGSGSSLPADNTDYSVFFNSTDSKIYHWTSGAWATWPVCLPFALVNVNSGTIDRIIQVFNGAGYIGHHGFVLPGVSCLIADGKNSDGTLNSVLSTTTTLTFAEMRDPSYASNYYYPIMIGTGGSVQRSPYRVIGKHEDLIATSGVYQYVIEENRLYAYNQNTGLYQISRRIPFVEYDYDDGSVYLFKVAQPIRLDDKASLGGNNTLFGNNNFKGRVEFENSVDLGDDATVDTPTIGDPGFSVRQVANLDCVQTFFANAIGTPRDVTILWGNGTGVNTMTEFQLSEDFTNFEQIGYVNADDNGNAKNVFIQSTYWLNYLLQNVGQNNVLLGGTSMGAGCAINGYSNTSNPSTTTKFVVGYENNLSYYIFGINRKLTTVEDPLA